MSEDEKPIFPRSAESSDAEKNELRQKAKLNLELEEHRFQSNNNTVEQKIYCPNCQTESSAQAKYCRVCGKNLEPPLIPPPTNNPPPDFVPSQLVYGPPNFWLKKEEKESDDDIHTTAYGPPPMSLPTDIRTKVYEPPPMKLPTELPITIPGLKIDREYIPASPPVKINRQNNNTILWLAIGLLSGLLIAAAIFIILILVFLRFR